jgi:tetratricopeptide (TPR) repeat protein
MDEELNYLYEDNFSLNTSLNKFKAMLHGDSPQFFDVQEFEDIIEYYTEQQNYKYADQAIRYANILHPNTSTFKLKESRLLIEKGAIKKAIRLLNETEPFEHQNFELFFLKGIAYFTNGEQYMAKENFELAISLCEAEEREDLLYQIAINLLQLEEQEKAIHYLLEAYAVNSSNLLVIYEIACTYEMLGEYSLSSEFYKKYLEIEPFAEAIWNALGTSLAEENKIEEAIEAFEYALAINPMYTSPYLNKASMYIKYGKVKKAIQIYNELLPLDINNAQVYYLIGECHEKNSNLVLALEYFKKAKTIDETFSDAWFGIGTILAQFQKHKECIKYFEKAISYDDENPDYWYNAGVAYAKLNKINKSVEAFENVVRLDKFDTEAWVELSKLFVENKKYSDAIQVLNRAYQHNYDNANVNFALSRTYFLDKQVELAVKYFEKGIELDFAQHEDLLKELPCLLEQEQFIDLIKKHS